MDTHKIHIILITGKKRVEDEPKHQIRNHHGTCICLETKI
jgi:hypothetical protein